MPTLKAGLVGGLLLTSSPFWWFASWIVERQSFLATGSEFLQRNVFGWSKWYPYWIPNFLIGFMVAVVALTIFRRLKGKFGRANAL
jgi:hypothetical protein